MDNILIISDFPDVQYKKDSGTPALRLIVEALSEKYRVHIVAPRGGAEDTDRIKYYRIDSPVSENPVFSKLFWFSFMEQAYQKSQCLNEVFDFKLIYGAGCKSTVVAGKLSESLSIPSIGRLFGTYLYPSIQQPFNINRVIKFEEVMAFHSSCTKFIITNDGTGGDKVADYYGIPARKVCFWRNGVDIPPATEKTDTKTHVISLARLEKWKHVEKIISAFSSIAKENDDVVLDIVGDGIEQRNLKHMVYSDSNLAKKVVFHGEVTRKAALELLAKADIFMSTNDYSNVSNSLLEAMISGKTVIALDTGTTSELFPGMPSEILRTTGLLAKDESDLKQALLIALNPDWRKALGENAKKYAETHFVPWKIRIDREVEVCEEVMICG